MSFGDYRVTYFTGQVAATGLDNVTATISEYFNNPIVAKCSDYIVNVERFELSLNGIPFYNAGGSVTITNTTTNVVEIVVAMPDAYSLPDLCASFNLLSLSSANAALNQLQLGVDADGFVIVYWAGGLGNAHNYRIEFSDDLNRLLGIGFTLVVGNVVAKAKSISPRLDMADNLQYIALTTTLPVVSDNFGNVKTTILTDFALAKNFGGSHTVAANQGIQPYSGTVSYSPRQKILYVPEERRFLNMTSDAPLNRISVTANYVDIDGNVSAVVLPPGGIFSIKLGFYLRLN